MSRMNASIIPELKSSRIPDKVGIAKLDFNSVKERYEKRIKLLDNQIKNLKNKPMKLQKEVRKMNSVEKVFDESVSRIKEEIFKRKYESFDDRNKSIKVSYSQPSIYIKKDMSMQPNPSAVPYKDFTDTDKM